MSACPRSRTLRLRSWLQSTTEIASGSLALAAALVAAPLPAQAQQNNWTGAASTDDWFTAGNWSAGVPTADRDTTINRTSPNPTVLDGGATGGPAGATQDLNVGVFGTGALTIVNGGTLTSRLGIVGNFGSAQGTVIVTGAGSSWTSSTDLRIGFNGATGEVTIADGGVVSAANTSVGLNQSLGTINIGAAPGAAPVAPGTLNTAAVTFGAGTINFNHTATDYVFAPAISGPGAVNALAGTTILTGNSTYTGGTAINTGATLQLGNGGTTGSIVGDVVNNGVLAFNRSDLFAFGGSIFGTGGAVEQNGPGTIILTGTNTYTGGTTINAGTLAVSADNALGAAAGALTINAGTLQFLSSFNLSSLRPISVNAPNSTIDTQQFTTTISQGITGSGALIKQGLGMLTLTGDNTYTGGTTINAGMLQLGDGGTAGSIVGDVANNGVFAFNRSDTLMFGGAISGSGALQQNGPGTTILTGKSTYTGPTTVAAGGLIVDGSIANSPVTVNAGALLGGSGTVGPTTVAGTLAPGAGLGALTIQGNLSLSPAATYLVDITPAAAERANVTGSATLGGNVQVMAVPGAYTPGTRYTILTAAAGVSGAFTGVNEPFPFLNPVLSTDANNAFLTLARNQVTHPGDRGDRQPR